MKRLFIIFPIILLLGCVGLSVKKTEIQLQGLTEVEGVELKSLDEWLHPFTLKEIQGWQVTVAEKLHRGEDVLGAPGEMYQSAMHYGPEGEMISLVSVVREGVAVKLETIAFWAMTPMGPMPMFTIDRYYNTEQWYSWIYEEYIEQHPEGADPARFQRPDACLKMFGRGVSRG